LRLGCHHTQTLTEPPLDFLQTLQVRVPILWCATGMCAT
jgi:hypothetical protein